MSRFVAVSALLSGGLLLVLALRPRPAVTPTESGPERVLSSEELEQLMATPKPGVNPTRKEFLEAGLSIDVTDPALQVTSIDAGVNRIVRVVDNKAAVLILNSMPAYPWMDLDGLRAMVNGTWKAWQKGPGEVPGARVAHTWPGDWAWEEGEKRLVLLAEGRVTVVTAPSWDDPRLRQPLLSLQPLAGGDYRSTYLRIRRAPNSSQGGVPPAPLVEDLDKALRLVEAGFEQLGPSIRQGAAAWRAKKLDHLDAMILLDLLRPPLAQLERQAMSEAMKNSNMECPVSPDATNPGPEQPPHPEQQTDQKR